MGANYTTKACIDCGLVMENCPGARKRCPECAKIWARMQNASARKEAKRRKKMGIVIPKITPTLSSKYCNGCVYYSGGFENNKTCNYIFMEGHSRPCPPGKDCTVKVKKSRINARDLTIDGKTMCVPDCAKLTGISKDTIYSWYTKFGREYTENKVIEVWNGRKEDG